MRFSHNGESIRYAVLIPTRGRAAPLRRALAGPMAFLTEMKGVWFAISKNDPDHGDYLKVFAQYRNLHVVEYWDETQHHQKGFRSEVVTLPGSVGRAREYLRREAIASKRYDYLVMTDDNARYTRGAVRALVEATYRWEQKYGPTFMAGMHSTAPHFDRNAIRKKKKLGRHYSYPTVAMIFHCVSAEWLKTYRYPGDCFALEDRHMIFTAIEQGIREFRVCMGAPFSKPRYQKGGQGEIAERMWKCGRSIERLAHDFPAYVGAKGTLPTPWKFIMEMADGAQVDRLPGGAMRRTDSLTKGA